MDEKKILVEISEKGVATVTINNPAKKNAIDSDMWLDLTAAFRALDLDDKCRVIVLTGAEGNFSSGGNPGMSQTMTCDNPVDMCRDGFYRTILVTRTIQELRKPVIAMVSGWAVGGAFSIALACDVLYAANDAKLWPNFMNIGVPPELGSLQTLAAIVGPSKAKEIFYTAEKISGIDGEKLGIVNKAFPAEELASAVYALAERISEQSAAPVQITKATINAVSYPSTNALFAAEMQNTAICTMSEESRALLMANFLKKK